MSLLILKLHIYYQRLPRCGWATQPQPSQWRRGSSPWRRWRSSPRLVSPRWTITTLRRSVRWYETTILSSFCNYKKKHVFKTNQIPFIRLLLELDVFRFFLKNTLFYHHIWDWPQKWLKISCLVRDFYISRLQRADSHHRPLSTEHRTYQREEISFLTDR